MTGTVCFPITDVTPVRELLAKIREVWGEDDYRVIYGGRCIRTVLDEHKDYFITLTPLNLWGGKHGDVPLLIVGPPNPVLTLALEPVR